MDPLPAPDPAFYPRAVALYARLSRNPNGTKDSVTTQLRVGQREAAKRWPGRPVRVFTDDDISADDEKYRPGYEAMLEAIASGEIGDVLCRVQARVSRGKVVWPRFQVICLAAGIEELTTWETGNVSMREGEDMAGDVVNLFNVHHRVTTKLSVRETLAERAAQGRPGGGQKYGYRWARNEANEAILVPVPHEARALNVAAEMLLAGHNQAAVARHLNAEGLLPRTGLWSAAKVKRSLMRPAIAGRHTRHGKVTGVPATWPAIVEPDLFDAVNRLLTQPRVVVDKTGRKRTYTGARRPSRVYLLTGGLARCGVCGTELIGQCRTVAKAGPTFHYICSSGKGGRGCVSIIGPVFETYVVGKFLEYVQTPAFVRFLAAGDVDAERRAQLKLRADAVTARRAEIGRALGRLEMSLTAGHAAEEELDRQQAEVDAERAALAPLGPIGMTVEAITVGWHHASLAEQQAWLIAAQMSLELMPAGGTRGVAEGRVELSFGGQTPAARARAKARRKPKPMKAKTSGG